jgi:hypothetical protein
MPKPFDFTVSVAGERLHRGDFSIVVITSLVSIGLLSAFSQLSLTLLLFAKHGAVFHTKNGSLYFAFLSDSLRTNSVLANAWVLSFIPSFTILVCVLTSYFWMYRRYAFVAVTCLTSIFAQLGLLFVIFFDNINHLEWHYVGVVIAVIGFLLMHVLLIHSDWAMLQKTWHPSIIFDSLLVFISTVGIFTFSVSIFLPYAKNTSVIAEWILLIILMLLQLNLPARAVRIALHVALATGTLDTVTYGTSTGTYETNTSTYETKGS